MAFTKDLDSGSNPPKNRGGVGGNVAGDRMLQAPASRGRSMTGDQLVPVCEAAEEESSFKSAVMTGLENLETGQELSLAELKARLLNQDKAGLASG